MMEPSHHGKLDDLAGFQRLDGPRTGRILIQGSVRPCVVIVLAEISQEPSKVPLIQDGLLAEEGDLVIVADAAWQERRQRSDYYVDYLTASRPHSLLYTPEEAG